MEAIGCVLGMISLCGTHTVRISLAEEGGLGSAQESVQFIIQTTLNSTVIELTHSTRETSQNHGIDVENHKLRTGPVERSAVKSECCNESE